MGAHKLGGQLLGALFDEATVPVRLHFTLCSGVIMTGIVQVGVGCFLFNSRFQLVTGVRKGSLGADFGESPEACAVREVLEETGIRIDENDVRFLTAVNTVFPAENKHYITLFVGCQVPDDSRPEVSHAASSSSARNED
ncbi:hypothetical protein Rhopal_001520-T1 [Rhodotorula paludigena]|uniref:Nudix hydrolase domain-containing protein n=1 Tax=Rhodotorula paludigena TaxID=86838 RepID=A0AAV5GDI4_9BASI|nr:hypothetical protein Rhopal_001520-T1 [Rhodotorula paludigena]